MEGARKLLVPLLIVLTGCHGTAEVAFPTYAEKPSPYVPNPASGNAFDAYVLAAGEVEAATRGMKVDPLNRSFFVPDQRARLLKALAPALRRVASAKDVCEFHFVPAKPGESLPSRSAWRLLGRALRWRIDDALAVDHRDSAIADTKIAMKFSADLCGGGPADRTLGIEIAEDVRQAMIPALPKLTGVQLRSLANVVKAGLMRRPPLTKTLDHGEAEMKLALQCFMDGFRLGEYGSIRTAMGKEFRDLESSLQEMKRKDGLKRKEFFEALNEDSERLSDAWREAAILPASRRKKVLSIKLTGERPRKAFARHFFLIGRPLLEIEDRSVARLRLFVLEAELRKVVLSSQKAPLSLAAVKAPWGIDPYNGKTFGYLPDGSEFRVYSVGSNLKDDLGDTDEAGLSPDVRTVTRT